VPQEEEGARGGVWRNASPETLAGDKPRDRRWWASMGKRRIFPTASIFVGTLTARPAHAGNVGVDKPGQSQFASADIPKVGKIGPKPNMIRRDGRDAACGHFDTSSRAAERECQGSG
jgi:hypothetical protein